MREEAKRWWEQAKDDLEKAKVLAENKKLSGISRKNSKMVRTKLITQLEEFRKELNKDTLISKMFLFGSRAWGKPHRDSDVDLLIVSPKFRREKRLERGLNFYNYWHLDYPVDFLCYTPEEFKKLSKQITLVRQVIREGIEIKAS